MQLTMDNETKKKKRCFKIYVSKFTNNMQLSSDYLSMDI